MAHEISNPVLSNALVQDTLRTSLQGGQTAGRNRICSDGYVMIDWARVSELRDEVGAEDFEEVVQLFLAEVEDVARSILMLMGRDAPMVTGAMLPIDGGFLAV